MNTAQLCLDRLTFNLAQKLQVREIDFSSSFEMGLDENILNFGRYFDIRKTEENISAWEEQKIIADEFLKSILSADKKVKRIIFHPIRDNIPPIDIMDGDMIIGRLKMFAYGIWMSSIHAYHTNAIYINVERIYE